MANLNRVLLIGNCTRDIEIRYTPKGTALAEIGLAVNRVYSTDDGEKKEEVTFVDVTLWGRLAEIAEKYVQKGQPIFIEGRLQLDSWDDKQTGQRRSKVRVVAENLQLLGSRSESKASSSGGGRPAPPQPKPSRPPVPTERPSGNRPNPQPGVDENGDPDQIPF